MFRRSDLGLVRIVPAAVALLVFAQTATLPATQDPPLPSGRDILAKHVKADRRRGALQGSEVHPRERTLRDAGAADFRGLRDDGRAAEQAARTKVSVGAIGEIESGYDGKVGWRTDPMQGPAVLTDKELCEAADDACVRRRAVRLGLRDRSDDGRPAWPPPSLDPEGGRPTK